MKIAVTTDTLGHKGEPGRPIDAEPCKKVKLNSRLAPSEIRELLAKKRKELTEKETS